jgi:hypothetical protein
MEGGRRLGVQLIRFSKRGFQQANRITLTESCRRNNSCSDAFPHHVRLAGTLKLFVGRVQSLSHLRKCLGSEHSK